MRRGLWIGTAGVAALAAVTAMGQSTIPGLTVGDDPNQARRQLLDAKSAAQAAGVRAEKLEADARNANAAADHTAREAAAVAARIQQAEAEIAADEARIRLIEQQRAELSATLARRQQPLLRLTGALQHLSRRPLIVSLLRPGSVQDAAHLRALLATMMPEVRQRTAALRQEIDKARALAAQQRKAQATLIAGRQDLNDRKQSLSALETRQRLAARDVSGSADRESERALALAERARDLGGLLDELDKAAGLREKLARLPGPIIRPDRPEATQASEEEDHTPPPAHLADYILPVSGRLIAGFGASNNGAASRGISLAVPAGAQLVTPAPGRVAFAGPYPGYGQITIIEHDGGWTSLVTGLGRVDVRVGDRLVAGAPLGLAGPGRPVVGLELRKDGQPANPLDQIVRR
ncbi:murein hydrolase activator EnvC family protein [Novosphingobium rosa]|uniref:murein hydrolase activator EnvC family protein n=1 Tax=Novosphingobium rosa TaxID=76978 RepID=UPI00082E8502|nr:peptidoglycan DD-metalloendopeptidase family protein [Novosphingobium rosa]